MARRQIARHSFDDPPDVLWLIWFSAFGFVWATFGFFPACGVSTVFWALWFVWCSLVRLVRYIF